ncbi:MAG TPA: endonuclease domain-containing protein [Rudaea sp.]|nr:endonuclease domain-containing protein [Rudaea sp.]
MRQGAKRQSARCLRKHLTEAEQLLWFRLRRRQLPGHRFRRQAPVGPYIVDFLCVESRLVIEVDGAQHGTDLDSIRDAWLRANGYHVLRFWNNDVVARMDLVLMAIVDALAETSPLRPAGTFPRKREKETTRNLCRGKRK